MSTPRFQGGRKKGDYKGEAPRPPKPGRNITWGESRPSRPREYTQTLPSDRDRMSMLSGQSDTPFKSRYGGRDEYDPIDARFNRQFDESPRGRQPWDSDPRGNPLERDPLEGYDTQGGRDVSRPTGRGIGSLGNVPPRVDSRPPRNEARSRRTGFYNTYSGDKGPFATGKDGYSGDMGPYQNLPKGDMGPFQGAGDVWDQSSGPEGRAYAGGGSPIEGVSGHDYLNDPKYKNHRKKSIINSPTQDLNKRDDCPC